MKNRINKLLNFAPIRVTYGILAAIVLKLPRIAFFSLSFLAIFWVGQQLYYRYAPADQFLDFYYAKVDDTTIGTEPLMTLCRRINYSGIRIEAYRTFIEYQGENSDKPVTVGEYNFEANVERGDGNCTNVRLRKQPQKVGTYKAYTEYVFYVNGNRKSGSYETNQYKMTPIALTPDEQINALQEQIQLLQAQIDDLKSRNNLNSSTEPTTTPQQPSQGASNAQNQQQATNSGSTQQNGSNSGKNSNNDNIPTPDPPTCIVPIFGGGLICGSDGILRL